MRSPRSTAGPGVRTRGARVGTLIAIAVLVPSAACTGVLGDFAVGVKGDGNGAGNGNGDDGSTGPGNGTGDDGGAGDDGGPNAGQDGATTDVTLAISPTSAMLSRGDMIQVAVDLSGPLPTSVDILLATAPLGVTSDPLRLPAGMTSGTLTLRVGVAAAAGTSKVIVAARVPGRTAQDVDASAPAADASASVDAGATDASSDAATVADAGAIVPTNGTVLPGDITAPFALTVQGANGGPDPTFGTGGVLVVHVSAGSDVPLGLAFDSKGQVVVIGQRGTPEAMVLARITEAGALDTTYGTTGYATVTGLAGVSVGTSLAIRADDGVYAAGTVTGTTSLLASFTSAGQLDTTFASGKGYVTIDSGGASDAVTAVIVAGTSVVVGGERTLGTRSQGLLLGFSAAGAFTGQATSSSALPTSVGSLLPNGVSGYWIGGQTASGGTSAPFDSVALGRGVAGLAQFDTSFGTGGFVSDVNAGSNFSQAPYAGGRVAHQSSGRLVVAGTPVGGACVLAGFSTSGSAPALDTTFGTGGVAGTSNGSANDIVADSADRLIVVGADFNLQRFTPSGAVDATFTDELSATFVTAEATRAAIDTKGRLIVVGKAQMTAGDDDWVIARFLP